MALGKARSLRSIVSAVFGILCLSPSGAGAQVAPWIGEWASPQCVADATKITLNRATIDLSTFETVCDIRGVRKRGAEYEFNAACRGEGSPLQATFRVRVDGDRLVFVGQKGFEFDPKRYSRCKAPEKPTAAPPDAAGLPLKLGYYVDRDTPCGQASNATLQLLRRTGIGASRVFCEFKRIEKLGATSYRVTEQCRELTDSRGGQARTGTYAISNNSAFAWTAADGSKFSSRLCEQSTLPAPWRDNDIGSLLSKSP